MNGELDFSQSLLRRVSLLKGLDAKVLGEIAARLPITPGAERLIRTLRSLDYRTAILSGGFSFFGEELKRRLGIDFMFANELEIEGGRLTGRVRGEIVDGARKAALLRQLAEQEGLRLEQTIAVGDGANDLPMLDAAGLGIAFHAKPRVRASAEQAISNLGPRRHSLSDRHERSGSPAGLMRSARRIGEDGPAMNRAENLPNPPAKRPFRGLGRATEALESQAFRRIFVSNMAFFLAMGGQSVVRPWLAFELTDSAFALAIVSAATAVPMLVLSPFGGVLADRMERRLVILLAQSLAVVAELVPLVLLHFDRLEFWHLVVTASLMGCVFPMIMPARSAIVVNMVGKKGLGSAMALNMTGVNVTRVVGPALAGSADSADRGRARLPRPSRPLRARPARALSGRTPASAGGRPHQSIGRNMLEGFQYLGKNRLVLILLLYGLVPQFLAMPFQTLLPAFARDVWHMDEFGFGVLSAASGIGAATGSSFVAARRPDAGRLSTMMFSVVAFGLLLAAFAASPWFWPAVALVFLANIFASTFSTLNNVAIQLVIPDSIRGRISSFLMMSVSLPLLGTLPIGAVAEKVGAPAAVAGASLLASLAAVVFYFGSRNLRELDAQVHRSSKEE